MKNIFFLSIIIANCFACRSVQAQDNTANLKTVLDSMVNCYKGHDGYYFNYGQKSPEKTSDSESESSYTLETVTDDKDCDLKCVCNSYITYLSPEKSHLVLFPLSKIDRTKISVAGNAVTIEFLKENGTDFTNLTLSHPDVQQLPKIKEWITTAVNYCNAVHTEQK